MGALALYRGKLHRVPDVPRQWPMPPHTLTVQQFRVLTRKRAEALARLSPQVPKSEEIGEDEKNPKENEAIGDDGTERSKEEAEADSDSVLPDAKEGEESKEEGKPVEESKEEGKPVEESKEVGGGAIADVKMEEVSNDSNPVGEKEKRKIELEKKLHVLNEKKHHLVQMLKQILNAEEEIKRRNAQAAALRSSNPLQAETTADMGSVTKHVPKLSVEVNFSGDLGGESDATANHSAHARQIHHVHSISPSVASLSRPFHGSSQQNALLSTPRTGLMTVGHGQTPMGSGAAASPSRFAPPGHQGHQQSASLPPVSGPASHLVASSPSPAASGGASSVFRDSRLTSSS